MWFVKLFTTSKIFDGGSQASVSQYMIRLKGRNSTTTRTQWFPEFPTPPMKVWPFLFPTFTSNASRLRVPKLNSLLFLLISLTTLTTTLGHKTIVSCCMVFNWLDSHVTWSVDSQPRSPDAARRESSSGVKPRNKRQKNVEAFVFHMCRYVSCDRSSTINLVDTLDCCTIWFC